MSTQSAEEITAINQKHPVNFLIDLVEDDQDTQEIVEELLDINGLKNRRIYSDPEVFIKDLEEHPDIKAQICIFDYDLKRRLTGLDLAIYVRKVNPDSKIIMLTAMRDPDIMEKFIKIGGRDWVNKGRDNFQNLLVESLHILIEEVKKDLLIKAKLDQIEEPIIRPNRQPLSVAQTNK